MAITLNVLSLFMSVEKQQMLLRLNHNNLSLQLIPASVGTLPWDTLPWGTTCPGPPKRFKRSVMSAAKHAVLCRVSGDKTLEKRWKGLTPTP